MSRPGYAGRLRTNNFVNTSQADELRQQIFSSNYLLDTPFDLLISTAWRIQTNNGELVWDCEAVEQGT
jgi:hypothetical protein